MSWRVLQELWKGKGGKDLEKPRQRGVFAKWYVYALAVVVFVIGACFLAVKPVTLIADGKETTVKTFSRTVAGALKAGGVTLMEKDEVLPSADSLLKKRMVVTVNRAMNVNITVDGCDLAVRSLGSTVKDVLDEYGIDIGPEDEVDPSTEAPVIENMNVLVARILTKTEESEAPVDFETVKKFTVKMPQGSTRVAQEGREGAERRTWRVTYRDGCEIARQMIARELIKPAIEQVIMVGSGLVVSRGGEDIRYAEAVDMLSSGYTYTGYNTASGVPPHYGVVAVDPGRIPLGTEMYVDGYGYATALDRGSSIIGNRIDLFFESYEEAMDWGLRWTKTYIID